MRATRDSTYSHIHFFGLGSRNFDARGISFHAEAERTQSSNRYRGVRVAQPCPSVLRALNLQGQRWRTIGARKTSTPAPIKHKSPTSRNSTLHPCWQLPKLCSQLGLMFSKKLILGKTLQLEFVWGQASCNLLNNSPASRFTAS